MKNSNSKNHIDVVLKYFVPVAAGIETNVLETYSILLERGWSITIHTSRDMYEEKDVLPESSIIKGLRVKRYHFGVFGFSPDINWAKTDLVCLHNFDIFPHFQIMLRTFWLKITKNKNFKLIITPHGGFNPEWSVFPVIQRIVKCVYHYTLGAIIANLSADGIRAVSDWEKGEMLKHGLRKKLINVISNGIEKEAYLDIDFLASNDIKDQVKKYGKYLIQIGRVYPIKNYETVIRALYYLPKDINYVIAGPVSDKKYMARLDKLIRQLSLEKRVFFAGVIRGVDKYYLIKQAQMMVHMALWESFCNVIHEGMSQNLVCIVADNTALPFLVKDKINGYCIKTKDYAALAKKIIFVLNNANSSEIKEMKLRNRTFSLEHSWTGVAEKMNDWYARMIEINSKSDNDKKKLGSELSVTVGIPAYNEEKNIGNIIKSVLKQRGQFKIEKIIIVCDGCSDKTSQIVKRIARTNSKVKFMDDRKRLGKSARLNQLYSLNKSDYLLTLDADVMFDKKDAIEGIIRASNENGKFDVITATQTPLKPRNFVGKMIHANYLLWNKVIANLNKGRNIHGLQGAVVMIRKSFADSFRFPTGITCDEAYLYVISSSKGKYTMANNVQILHHPVTSFSDIRKLSSRISRERDTLVKFFGEDILELFKVPVSIKLKSVAQSLLENPIYTLGAMFIINPYVHLFPHKDELNSKGMWEPVLSTKDIMSLISKNK